MGKRNKSTVDFWLTDEGLEILEGSARAGFTDSEICTKYGINRNSFKKWKNMYPQISDALFKAREVLNYSVEKALIKLALGYQQRETKVTVGKSLKGGEMFEVLKETTTKEVGPNYNAIQFYLINRMNDRWTKDGTQLGDGEDSGITITINRGVNNRKEDDGVNDSVTVDVDELKEKVKEENSNNNEDTDLDYWPEDWEDDEDDDG